MRSGRGRRTAGARESISSGEICAIFVEALWLPAKSSALFAFVQPTLKTTNVAELFFSYSLFKTERGQEG